jgi:pyrimidine operon attenuation protein/uracil phosphoribosyltransferase
VHGKFRDYHVICSNSSQQVPTAPQFIIYHSSFIIEKMQVLNDRKIRQKIRRLAIEILEHNHDETELILAGINNRGMAFAKLLEAELKSFSKLPISLTQIRVSPADPLSTEVTIGMPIEALRGKVVIIVDDVANTGRTIFYACKPLLETLPKKVEVAVIVDRSHKSFPVKVDYFGISLATTLLENIDVQVGDDQQLGAFLN